MLKCYENVNWSHLCFLCIWVSIVFWVFTVWDRHSGEMRDGGGPDQPVPTGEWGVNPGGTGDLAWSSRRLVQLQQGWVVKQMVWGDLWKAGSRGTLETISYSSWITVHRKKLIKLQKKIQRYKEKDQAVLVVDSYPFVWAVRFSLQGSLPDHSLSPDPSQVSCALYFSVACDEDLRFQRGYRASWQEGMVAGSGSCELTS